jgi:hypothetical protein
MAANTCWMNVITRMCGGAALCMSASLSVGLTACNDERTYLGDGAVYQVAITEDTEPAFVNGEDSLYVVESRIELPMREPTDQEIQSRYEAASSAKSLPFDRLPWVDRGDVALEVDFTLINLDKDAHDITLTVNGFNEFDEYVPGVRIVDRELVVDFAQWEKVYRLEPKERRSGTIREEELDEVAVDLSTVVNGAPNSNQIVYFENHSADDVRAQPFIPSVVAGLMGLRLGLRSDAPVNVLVEATLRARDSAGKLVQDGEAVFQVQPTPFTPVAPEEE